MRSAIRRRDAPLAAPVRVNQHEPPRATSPNRRASNSVAISACSWRISRSAAPTTAAPAATAAYPSDGYLPPRIRCARSSAPQGRANHPALVPDLPLVGSGWSYLQGGSPRRPPRSADEHGRHGRPRPVDALVSRCPPTSSPGAVEASCRTSATARPARGTAWSRGATRSTSYKSSGGGRTQGPAGGVQGMSDHRRHRPLRGLDARPFPGRVAKT